MIASCREVDFYVKRVFCTLDRRTETDVSSYGVVLWERLAVIILIQDIIVLGKN